MNAPDKSVLSALGLGRLDMSVPTVITGFSIEDLGLADAEWSRIDFATEIGSFVSECCRRLVRCRSISASRRPRSAT